MAKKQYPVPEPTTMLYRHPGKKEIHDDVFDTLVVKDSELDQHIALGWRKTTDEAIDLHFFDQYGVVNDAQLQDKLEKELEELKYKAKPVAKKPVAKKTRKRKSVKLLEKKDGLD